MLIIPKDKKHRTEYSLCAVHSCIYHSAAQLLQP